MGYTHYWETHEDGEPCLVRHEDWAAGLESCNKMLESLPKGFLGDNFGEEPWKRRANGIAFNGLGDDAHETFILEATAKGQKWAFCKTARKPYDIAVTACLVLMHDACGDYFRVTSDGTLEEWAEGIALAERCLGYDVSFYFA